MKRKIKKLLEKFKYAQYVEEEIIKLLEGYPSFVKFLQDVAKSGVEVIEIGAHNPNASKPTMEVDLNESKVIIHHNGHYDDE